MDKPVANSVTPHWPLIRVSNEVEARRSDIRLQDMAVIAIASFAVACAICYALLHFLTWQWRRQHLYKLASKFGGPPALPFIGNAHQLIGSGEYILRKLTELSTVYPSPSRMWLGPYLLMLISEPEQIKEICLNPNVLGKGPVTEFFTSLVGTGLFTAPVSKWKVHRKLIQPTFNTKILDTFVEVFSAQAKIFSERIEKHLNGSEFDVFNLVSLCTLDMICESIMDVEVGAQTNKNVSFVEAEEKALACAAKRIFSFWLYPDMVFYRSQLGRDQRKYIKFMLDFTNNVVKNKKNKLSTCDDWSDTENEDDACKTIPRRKALLHHLMTLPDKTKTLSDDELRDEVITFVVAGHDTTAIVTSFVMLMLATYPDVQDKVYQELHEIYGDHDIEERPVLSEDLTRMKYLERVIKETLRLFPALPFFIRDVAADVTIDGQTLPSGCTALITVLPLHRSEKYWPDPLKFNPDRFLPEETAKRHPYAFIPFSGGPRNCVGLVYGMMAMKTLVATVLRKYVLKIDDIVPVKDIQLKYESLLKPANRIKLKIARRSTGVTLT